MSIGKMVSHIELPASRPWTSRVRSPSVSPLNRLNPLNPWLILPATTMIAIGTRLGAYQITSLLGQGGMGEVYRATDTKLNRDVALKFLPEQFISDRDRLERFQREAHVLASLSHSNIAAIYGFEDAEPMRALVMELVEGSI